MRKTLMIIAMCVTVALNAQDAEYDEPRFESDTTGFESDTTGFESDTTGKVNLKIKSIFELTDLETWVMHFLRSKVEYGDIQNGVVYKRLPNRSKFIVYYENAKLITWIKNDHVIKKQIEYDGEVITTEYKE